MAKINTYYVYAGYYENFISGHKLPKPYTLRDEFKTFDEALDYVWENWEDDAIFFTEDVIGDAIDNGFINDENWEDYLMEESKKSARKSIKESKVISYDEFQDICEEESNDVIHFHEYKGAYFVILGKEKECEKLNEILRDEYNFSTTYYKILDPRSGFNGYFEIMCV